MKVLTTAKGCYIIETEHMFVAGFGGWIICEKGLRKNTERDRIKLPVKKGKVVAMNNIDIANGMVFQKLEIEKETFDERLICQKKMYLLEALGTDLGYNYNWYVRGPYSPSLTSYVYNNLDVLKNNDFSKYKLSESAERNIQQVNELVKEKKQDMSVASWYELLASLVYIYNNKESWKVDGSVESIFATLMRYKPQYNEMQCQYAYEVLRQRGVLKVGV